MIHGSFSLIFNTAFFCLSNFDSAESTRRGLNKTRHHEPVRISTNTITDETNNKNFLDAFWSYYPDRVFMTEFYPVIGKYFSRILDIGARDFNFRCKDMITSQFFEDDNYDSMQKPQYWQMEPFPDEEMNNDGLLEVSVQKSLLKYPKMRGSFDAILDFGVLGYRGIVEFDREESEWQITAYVENILGLLSINGLYVLKVDGDARERVDFARYIDPYFEHVDFDRWTAGEELDPGGYYKVYFLRKRT